MIKKIASAIGYFVLGLAALFVVYAALMFCGFIMCVVASLVGVEATVVIMLVVAFIAGVVTQVMKGRVETI